LQEGIPCHLISKLGFPVTVIPGPDVALMLDPDQIEQMLINLVRNAVEAVLPPEQMAAPSNGDQQLDRKASNPEVTIEWTIEEKSVVFVIEDNAPDFFSDAANRSI